MESTVLTLRIDTKTKMRISGNVTGCFTKSVTVLGMPDG
jgi:hypothetical protein